MADDADLALCATRLERAWCIAAGGCRSVAALPSLILVIAKTRPLFFVGRFGSLRILAPRGDCLRQVWYTAF
jgi:hypothetical protein